MCNCKTPLQPEPRIHAFPHRAGADCQSWVTCLAQCFSDCTSRPSWRLERSGSKILLLEVREWFSMSAEEQGVAPDGSEKRLSENSSAPRLPPSSYISADPHRHELGETPVERRSPLQFTSTPMRLLYDTPQRRGKSPSTPSLYHALVGPSTNSTLVPIGFRLRSDTDPLGESAGGGSEAIRAYLRQRT